MKRFSILCCLVLLLNVLCPAGHVHAETVTTPTDLCEHDWALIIDGAEGHHKECKHCSSTEKTTGHYTSCTSSTPDVCEACGYQGEGVSVEHSYGCWPDGDDCVFGCPDCKTEYSRIEHVVSCTEPNRCEYCGAVGDWTKVNHNWDIYSENYAVSEGAEGHHYVCQDCDAISATYKHGTTCDDPTHCLECGYEGTIESVLHAWGECVSFGEEGHGYVCSVCSDKLVRKHSARCDDPTHCILCDYEGVIDNDCISHTSDFVYTSDGAEGHHYGCPVCGYVSSSDSHQVYCDDPTHCADCGAEVKIDENDLWHDLKYVCDNAVEHHLECTKCGYTCLFNPHAANCTNPNLCVSCGYEGPCSSIYHNYQLISTDDAGNLFECSDCGKTSIVPHYAYCDDPTHCCYFFCDYEGTIDNISHHLDEYVIFGEDGHGYVCSACNEKMVYEHRASCDDPTHCMYCDYEGKFEIVQHEYHNYVSNGADGHTKTCTTCGKTVTESHSAYCTDLTHCMYCGYEGTIETIRHYWDEDELVSFGEEGHGHVCDRCGKKGVSEHQASCDDPTRCESCNYKGTIDGVSHANLGFISIDAKSHYYGCKDCGYVRWSGRHYAYCDDPTHCAECGYEGTIETVLHNDNSELVSFGAEGHGRVCESCGEKMVYGHTAYCNAPTHCRYCGYEGTFDEDEIAHVSLGYTSDGAEGHHYGCTACGYVSWSGSHHADCDAPTHCTSCGYEGEIAKEDMYHNWTRVVSDGRSGHHAECANCGYIGWYDEHNADCRDPNHCLDCDYEGPCGYLYHDDDLLFTDDDGHHFTCLDCGRTYTEPHYARCDDASHCLYCDYEGAIEEIYHYRDERISFGEEGCGYVCEKCGEKIVDEHHAFCDDPTHCVDCGYEGSINDVRHKDYDYTSDGADGHTFACATCGETCFSSHSADCDAPTRCAECGYEGTIDSVSHTDWGYTSDGAEGHHYGCKACGYVSYSSSHFAYCDDLTHCYLCSYEGEIDEDFLMHDWEYVSDGATTHHQKCTKCGYSCSPDEHVADCGNPNLCVLCGYEGPCGSLYHNYRWVSSDDAGHHYQCPDCGATKTISHYAFCDDTSHCVLCDYEGDIEDIYHYWLEYISFGEEGCGYICNKCGEKVVYEHHADCDDPTHCAECGYEGENITVCHNRHGNCEGYDANQHWYTCGTCKELIKENHSWGKPVVEGSKKIYTCIDCDATKTESLHSHKWGDPVTVEPTCTEEGAATYTCTCGKTKVETIAALGHSYGACMPTGSGSHYQTCADCGKTVATACTKVDTRLGNLDASACIYCGYITWELDDANGKQEGKVIENATFQLVDETGAAIEASSLSLVVYESAPEATILLDTGASLAVKKALTITVLEDSTPVKLAGTVKLSIPMEDDLTGLKLLVMDENGELVEIAYEVVDGVMIFETDILGIFMLVEEI